MADDRRIAPQIFSDVPTQLEVAEKNRQLEDKEREASAHRRRSSGLMILCALLFGAAVALGVFGFWAANRHDQELADTKTSLTTAEGRIAALETSEGGLRARYARYDGLVTSDQDAVRLRSGINARLAEPIYANARRRTGTPAEWAALNATDWIEPTRTNSARQVELLLALQAKIEALNPGGVGGVGICRDPRGCPPGVRGN